MAKSRKSNTSETLSSKARVRLKLRSVVSPLNDFVALPHRAPEPTRSAAVVA
eukprot:CAMPEP_0172824350 /NCGR_PEP_ID=MMETSP1075-20121228/17954_1 /TAXON_ID=2916 /ORGANISM="Ceratium fusus, Strain PA161109" /LENGTH=51 /DNA_ID=CAMNT_0013665621 /DNA_START=125 /DNA_END=277 /DNA_ORIENTATION=+